MQKSVKEKSHPILYSFRRCPFAIRARIAIYFSNTKVEIREVLLNNKPDEMLALSNKGTVPILLTDEKVFDESLDIMIWALSIQDDKNLLTPLKENKEYVFDFISYYDTKFKNNLDKYKYSSRYINCEKFLGKTIHRDLAEKQLIELNTELKENGYAYIYKNKLSILDICIFPFVRQFRIANVEWFDTNEKLKFVNNWLNNLVTSEFFRNVMLKYTVWQKGHEKCYFHK